MRRELAFLGELSDADKVFVSRIAEWTELCSEKYIDKYTSFLNEHQTALCRKVFSALSFKCFRFYGGREGAVRCICGMFPPCSAAQDSDFPLRAVTFFFRKTDKLTHRDFLGCIMSLGIERDTVGDIVVGEGHAVVFATELAAGLIQGIDKIGRVGVRAEEGFDEKLIPEQKFQPIEASVSSVRFDCVVSAAVHISREKAAAMIRHGLAELNYMDTASNDKKLEEGDVFSVRGFGKFILESIGTPTRKDRLHITVKKYL